MKNIRFALTFLLLACDKSGAQDSQASVPDADGDGHGADVDCDDTDPSIYPGAVEYCDGINTDCDGGVDENDAVDAATWYQDADGDDFGFSGVIVTSCEQPPGFVADSTDCDDSSALAYPGAEEVCDDGVDNDCDNDPDDCMLSGELPLANADLILRGLSAGDATGVRVTAGDLNGDGLSDLLVGAPDNDVGGSNAGAVYLLLGPIQDSDLSLSDAILYGGGEDHNAGAALRSVGDADGDGIGDVLVSAQGADGQYVEAGETYLVAGPVTGAQTLSALAIATLSGESSYDAAGDALAHGDFDGDGVMDVWIGASGMDRGGDTDAGSVYLVSGPVTGAIDIDDADAKIYGEYRYDRVGSELGAGDFNGDGMTDLVLGAWSYPAEAGNGAAAVFLAPLSGEKTISSADALWKGTVSNDQLGLAIGVGDLDCDGYDDVLAGAPNAGDSGEGVVYLYSGANLEDLLATISGVTAGDLFGSAISADGDVDGDGCADVFVGAPQQASGGTDAGAGYLFYGPISGTLLAEDAPLVLTGESAFQSAGDAGTIGVDINDDGLDDVLLGAPGDDVAGTDAGAVYGVLGTGL